MSTEPVEITLNQHQVISLHEADGRTIEAAAGTLWLTPGDGSDVVLEAGESYLIAAPGQVVVSAVRGTATARLFDMPALSFAA